MIRTENSDEGKKKTAFGQGKVVKSGNLFRHLIWVFVDWQADVNIN